MALPLCSMGVSPPACEDRTEKLLGREIHGNHAKCEVRVEPAFGADATGTAVAFPRFLELVQDR
jgi:hypothetical protein